MIAASTLLAAPAAMCLAAVLNARPSLPDDRLKRLPEAAAILALLAALAAGGLLLMSGSGTSPVLGLGEIGLSARLDSVSVAMVALTGFLGWVLVRFAATHLRDSGIERTFTARLCATLGGLLLLATAGHLGQLVAGVLLTGYGLTRLLSLFAARPALARAVVKHRVISGVGDVALIAGAACLIAGYGTSEIGAILDAARAGDHPPLARIGAGFIGLAAVAKAALLPAHVWLRDVEGAPLPLAALAQTLIVATGTFLAIRLADLLVAAPLALAGMAALGGATALVAGFAAAMQAGGRGGHSWSTISQSGFAMLLCGLGLFPLALLHLAGHALHRAHAILARERPPAPTPPGAPRMGTVVLSMTVALAIYGGAALAGWLLGVPPQVLTVGAILSLGLGCIAAQGASTVRDMQGAAQAAVLLAAGFLGFQWLAFTLTGSALPPVPEATALDWVLMLLAFFGFALATLVQTRLRAGPNHPLLRGLRVHVANGFYLDALANRLLGGWRTAPHGKEI